MNKYAQMADRLYDLNEQVERLKKENVEVREELTKAKGIIRNLLRVTYGEGWNYSLDVKVKAEQFLKENE